MTTQKHIYIAALLILVACAKPQVTGDSASVPSDCVVLPSTGEVADTVRVALSEPVGPAFAPWPRNDAEALLFRHFYETLIATDCLGRVQPSLAWSWRKVDRGRHWVFKLRDDARFWDGSRVTAKNVVWSWQLARFDPATLNAAVDSVVAEGDLNVHVYFRYPHRKVPRLLSSLAFAVAKPAAQENWLTGSGAYRMSVTGERRSWGLERRILAEPTRGAKKPVIDFLETSDRDPRDLLESGVDMVITSDPAVIEYASARVHFAAVPLLWDRTYLFLSPGRVRILANGGKTETIPGDFLEALAKDAVRSDAQGFRAPSWWSEFRVCEAEVSVTAAAVPERGQTRRILYDSDDPVARDLTQRIVSLLSAYTGTSPGTKALDSAVGGARGERPVGEGVARENLNMSLQTGEDWGYIVSIPRLSFDPCHSAAQLIARAPWVGYPNGDLQKTVIPLVDTRKHVIARRDRFGLIGDGYGRVLVVGETPRGTATP